VGNPERNPRDTNLVDAVLFSIEHPQNFSMFKSQILQVKIIAKELALSRSFPEHYWG
jgi:hypothetical protein